MSVHFCAIAVILYTHIKNLGFQFFICKFVLVIITGSCWFCFTVCDLSHMQIYFCKFQQMELLISEVFSLNYYNWLSSCSYLEICSQTLNPDNDVNVVVFVLKCGYNSFVSWWSSMIHSISAKISHEIKASLRQSI